MEADVPIKIADLFGGNHPLLSFEFFPPKKPESEHILHDTVNALRRFNPDFVSVTYGAGGSTRSKSIDWTFRIREIYGQTVMMHLTCIASMRKDIDNIVERLTAEGVKNIMALRGDPPIDLPPDEIKKEYQYAYQLVRSLREHDDFCIGVAGYPEGHTEAPSLDKDIEYLKLKVDSGAEFIVTQLFFHNGYFYDFMDRAAKAGINVPIIPGIMPIVNITQIQKFAQMCGATVPGIIVEKMQDKSLNEMVDIGVEYAIRQCSELLDFGVPGLHFYTLNRNIAAERILDEIKPELGR
jgi:methylenetetrahydrofolate reductase (NADPH)